MEAGNSNNFSTMAEAVAERTAAACAAGRPLFFIVHYEHETIKLSFLAALRKALAAQEIYTQTFDPAHRPEHGVGRLYPLMAQSAGPRAVALIEGLLRNTDTNSLDTTFLEYLNLHRDLIVKKHLRLILFMHTADAGDFISGAGDLWDFRHHTYWLEGRPAEPAMTSWTSPDFTSGLDRLPETGRTEVENHLRQVQELVEKTNDPEAKGQLLLDLSQWLFRRHLYSPAAEVASEGLDLPMPVNSDLFGDLEFYLAYALRKSHHLGDALTHYQRALAIRREIGDRAGEGTTLNNISQIYKAWGRYEEALKTLEESLAIRREIGDRAGEGTTLNNIASLYHAWGRYEEALKTLEESLAISREIGDRAGEAITCWNLAMEFHRRGDLEKAVDYARCTVAIDEATKHPDLDNDRAFLEKLEGQLAAEKAE